MKSLHLKKLAGVSEKMRTWGKSSSSDSDHESRHSHDRAHSHQHGDHHHHHQSLSHSQPAPQQHHHNTSSSPPHQHRHQHHEQHHSSLPPPSLQLSDEFTQGSSADEGEPSTASAGAFGVVASEEETSTLPAAFSSERDVVWEREPPLGAFGSSVEHDLSLLDDTPLLPELPPLPRPTNPAPAATTSKRRSSVPHVFSRRSREVERARPPATAPDLLLDLDGTHTPHGHGGVHSSTAAVAVPVPGEKGQKLEDKIKELKLRDLALREERTKERERRKEAERQLKAAQKERYIQGLKLKSLETKLEKVGGNRTDMEKRARKESQANAALQKDVDVLRSKLAERERALAERDEALVKVKRQYARIKQGGSDECSLEELEELDKVLEKSRNALLERIKLKVKEEMDDKSKCLICFDRTRAIIFVPCGHKVCCGQCSSQVKICPICRANIEIRQKVFE